MMSAAQRTSESFPTIARFKGEAIKMIPHILKLIL